MSKFKKFMKRKIVWFFLILFAFVYLNNSPIFLRQQEGDPLLLAHRGLGQTFPMEGITGETNTAALIYPPEHPYLENTIPSMEAAFQAGADIVELDIQPTTDGQFAVFHDWILDYRTNGKGVTREHTLAELKALDIGYGYTADQGKTHPFRFGMDRLYTRGNEKFLFLFTPKIRPSIIGLAPSFHQADQKR